MVTIKTISTELEYRRIFRRSGVFIFLEAEDATVGFDKGLLNHTATAARTAGGLGQKVVGVRAVASGDFIQNPVEWKFGIVVASLTRRDRLLRAANGIGTDGEKLSTHG